MQPASFFWYCCALVSPLDYYPIPVAISIAAFKIDKAKKMEIQLNR